MILVEGREWEHLTGVHHFKIGSKADGGDIGEVPHDSAATQGCKDVGKVGGDLGQLVIRDQRVGNDLGTGTLADHAQTGALAHDFGTEVHGGNARHRAVNDGEEVLRLELHVAFLVQIVGGEAAGKRVKDVKASSAVQVVPRQQPDRAAIVVAHTLTVHVHAHELGNIGGLTWET